MAGAVFDWGVFIEYETYWFDQMISNWWNQVGLLLTMWISFWVACLIVWSNYGKICWKFHHKSTISSYFVSHHLHYIVHNLHHLLGLSRVSPATLLSFLLTFWSCVNELPLWVLCLFVFCLIFVVPVISSFCFLWTFVILLVYYCDNKYQVSKK